MLPLLLLQCLYWLAVNVQVQVHYSERSKSKERILRHSRTGRGWKCFHNEVTEDESQDPKKWFRLEFYFHILDVLVKQFEKHIFLPNSKTKPMSTLEMSPQWVLDELLSFRAMWGKLEIKLNTTDAVLPFLICSHMERAFPNISILYHIYKTLPGSSANVERVSATFSQLESVSMHALRHSNLTFLSLKNGTIIW